MANRPTIRDVAREAGVSPATVDRALNGRSKVRDETLRKIAEAARRVGYHARGLIDQRLVASVPDHKIGLILIKEKQPFYRAFQATMEQALEERTDIRGRLVVRYAQSQSPEEFASLLAEVGARVDAVGAVAVNHQSLDKVVQDLAQNGVPTFSLLNDFAQGIRRNYIGLNNIKVGRQAAWMLTRGAAPGSYAIFVGGNRWHGHDLREVGFRAYMREGAPASSVKETLVNLETRQLTYEATLNLLERQQDLRGIYVAGGGMEGAIAALRETRPSGKVGLVVNELTADSRAGLLEGYVQMVIATPLEALCRELVALSLRSRSEAGSTAVEQKFLTPEIILPELL
ncbi:LacI family DNA-binding transcriptional regulator [Vannielia litorea]|uniref:LacI family DNA-binding transcriptional regulator n=1 Tax=Vannielia litorea TaxID=1217970 RepID=UPI001C96F363|nr:LacI family DNA-binding transcriptional regulator [Vannielia litorea]MBY6048787.1 LacI family DNA-binding transcriptional regulator [Vannielia litorea]MBY6076201.1 LacI family DNA-binding transcriptional regulator [Vannielia litorea]